jgi:hypothetical protein
MDKTDARSPRPTNLATQSPLQGGLRLGSFLSGLDETEIDTLTTADSSSSQLEVIGKVVQKRLINPAFTGVQRLKTSLLNVPSARPASEIEATRVLAKHSNPNQFHR